MTSDSFLDPERRGSTESAAGPALTVAPEDQQELAILLGSEKEGWSWATRESAKDLIVPYTATHDCGKSCALSQNNLGYYAQNITDRLYHSSKGTQWPGPVTPIHPMDPNRSVQMLNEIDRQLGAGAPVMVGISTAEGAAKDNRYSDNATEHQVDILGRSYDESGAVYYWGFDNATNAEDMYVRLYVNPETGAPYSPSYRTYEHGTYMASVVTNVSLRPNPTRLNVKSPFIGGY